MALEENIINAIYNEYEALCKDNENNIQYLEDEFKKLAYDACYQYETKVDRYWMLSGKGMMADYLNEHEDEFDDVSKTDEIARTIFWKDYYTFILGWLALKTGQTMAKKCEASKGTPFLYRAVVYDGHADMLHVTILVCPKNSPDTIEGPAIKIIFPTLKRMLKTPEADLVSGNFLVVYNEDIHSNKPNMSVNYSHLAEVIKSIWKRYL